MSHFGNHPVGFRHSAYGPRVSTLSVNPFKGLLTFPIRNHRAASGQDPSVMSRVPVERSSNPWPIIVTAGSFLTTFQSELPIGNKTSFGIYWLRVACEYPVYSVRFSIRDYSQLVENLEEIFSSCSWNDTSFYFLKTVTQFFLKLCCCSISRMKVCK